MYAPIAGLQDTPAVHSWDSGLKALLDQRILHGAALFTTNGRCVRSYGALEAEFRNSVEQEVFAQFLTLTNQEDAARTTFELMGHKLIVFQRSERSVYAMSSGRRLGLCLHALPLGLLLSTFTRSTLPQQVIPLLEKYCDELRN